MNKYWRECPFSIHSDAKQIPIWGPKVKLKRQIHCWFSFTQPTEGNSCETTSAVNFLFENYESWIFKSVVNRECKVRQTVFTTWCFCNLCSFSGFGLLTGARPALDLPHPDVTSQETWSSSVRHKKVSQAKSMTQVRGPFKERQWKCQLGQNTYDHLYGSSVYACGTWNLVSGRLTLKCLDWEGFT